MIDGGEGEEGAEVDSAAMKVGDANERFSEFSLSVVWIGLGWVGGIFNWDK